MHAVAKVNGTTIAETDKYEVVEGNIYFPADSINNSYYRKTDHTTFCPWKGTASYYTLNVDGKLISNGAWYYPQPLEKTQNIKDHVAFYKNKVDITSE
ncbi:DUF427 domain protein [Cryomyces antarcticus]